MLICIEEETRGPQHTEDGRETNIDAHDTPAQTATLT